jgi:flagellin-like protein
LTKIRNVRNSTKFKRSIKAISPVIATLLMIAIAVVASLVVYAWVGGYMGFQTDKAGKAIAIPSFALADNGNMIVYVQNVGQGSVQIGSIYVDDAQKADFTNDPTKAFSEGKTVELTIPGTYDKDTTYDIKVTTTDGTFMTATGKPGTGGAPTPSTSVPTTNNAPVLAAIGAKSVNEGVLLTFTASATDSDVPAQTLAYSLQGSVPTGAAITSAGVFTWTPSSTQGSATPYSITVRVTDSGSPTAYDEETIAVTVNDVAANAAPVLAAIGAKSVNEGVLLTFTISATDADVPAQTLTYSATGLPTGATFTPATRVFSWTPTSSQGSVTPYQITFRVTDNGVGALYDEETVAVTVNDVAANTAPVLAAIGAKSVDELATLTFTVSATDSDIPAQTLTYSATGLPSGATFNAGTRTFSWTPTEAQGPGSYPITVRVTDNGAGALYDEETITITVNEIHPQTIFTDAFPQGTLDTSKWTASGSVSISNNNPHQANDYYVSLTSGASITSSSISTANYRAITLSYYRNTDSGVVLTVQWRIGTGSWTTLETVPSNTNWNQVSLPLGSTADGQTIQIRFTTNSDSDRTRIDDVTVSGIPTL